MNFDVHAIEIVHRSMRKESRSITITAEKNDNLKLPEADTGL